MIKVIYFIFIYSSALLAQAGSTSAQSTHTPWGGYWWSMEDAEIATGWYSDIHDSREIFSVEEIEIFDECLDNFSYECNMTLLDMAGSQGQYLSPLMKFDYYVRQKLGPDTEPEFFSHATKREMDIHYIGDNKNHPLYENRGFAGKCIGWALSTMDYKEPTTEKLIDNILFTPADIKALLALKYNAAQLFVGDRFIGNSYLRSTEVDLQEKFFDDVTPKQLLKGFEATINKGLILEADLDPDYGVWNYPVFKYEFDWTQVDLEVEGSIKIYYMDDEVDKDDIFSTEQVPLANRRDLKTRTYTFRLKTKQNFTGKSSEVISSSWTYDSTENHPDSLILGLEDYWEDNISDYDDEENTEFNFEVFKENFLDSIINEYDKNLRISL